MKIVVNKCRITGKIFEANRTDEYRTHLLELRAELRANRALTRFIAQFNDWLTKSRATVSTLQEIPDWIISNRQYLIKAFNKICCNGIYASDRMYPSDEIEYIQIRSSHYAENIGLMYRCHEVVPSPPLSHEDVYHGGYAGRIECCLRRQPQRDGNYPMSRFLSMVGVYTGTGGGGNSRSEWVFHIKVSQWPGIRATLITKKLSGDVAW
jgi:hypothetical protein